MTQNREVFFPMNTLRLPGADPAIPPWLPLEEANAIFNSSITLVVKSARDCTQNCEYMPDDKGKMTCYMYVKDGWQNEPEFMDLDIVGNLARAAGAHKEKYPEADINVVLHGGEPLLMGVTRLEETLRILRTTVTGAIRIQTNATLLSEAVLDICDQYGVMVAVSLDGNRKANDRRRLTHRGKSTYDMVLKGINLLNSPKYGHLFSHIYGVIDIANDPLEDVYEPLAAYGVPMDLLLPHATWKSRSRDDTGTPHADWMIRIFDVAYARAAEEGLRYTGVRLLDAIIDSLSDPRDDNPNAKVVANEVLPGLRPIRTITVDTGGNLGEADTLLAGGLSQMGGMNIARTSLARALMHPAMLPRARNDQSAILGQLSEECQRCDMVQNCGGGFYYDRQKEGSFDNPSVYCLDLAKLILHVAAAAQLRKRKENFQKYGRKQDSPASLPVASSTAPAESYRLTHRYGAEDFSLYDRGLPVVVDRGVLSLRDEYALLLKMADVALHRERIPLDLAEVGAVQGWLDEQANDFEEAIRDEGMIFDADPTQFRIAGTRPQSMVWHARRAPDGAVMGVTKVQRLAESTDVVIKALAVHPEAQGRRIGSLLLSKAIQSIGTAGRTIVYVDERNAAGMAFVRSVGFEDTGGVREVALLGQFPVRQREMVLAFDARRAALDALRHRVTGFVSGAM